MALPSSHIPLPQRLIRPILDFEDDAVVKKDLEPAPQQHVGFGCLAMTVHRQHRARFQGVEQALGFGVEAPGWF